MRRAALTSPDKCSVRLHEFQLDYGEFRRPVGAAPSAGRVCDDRAVWPQGHTAARTEETVRCVLDECVSLIGSGGIWLGTILAVEILQYFFDPAQSAELELFICTLPLLVRCHCLSAALLVNPEPQLSRVAVSTLRQIRTDHIHSVIDLAYTRLLKEENPYISRTILILLSHYARPANSRPHVMDLVGKLLVMKDPLKQSLGVNLVSISGVYDDHVVQLMIEILQNDKVLSALTQSPFSSTQIAQGKALSTNHKILILSTLDAIGGTFSPLRPLLLN